MNFGKYIELLRFYLSKKIDNVNDSINKGFKEEISEIAVSLISAIFSVHISEAVVKAEGVGFTILKIFLPIIIWLFLKFFIWKKIDRVLKTKKEIKKTNGKKLSDIDIKNLIENFDHIACDGIVLAWDFWDKYFSTTGKDNEKIFYLIESFYYYKKTLSATHQIVKNNDYCINSIDSIERISKYRLNNMYESLNELREKIKNEPLYNKSKEFKQEFDTNEVLLTNISDYLKGDKK